MSNVTDGRRSISLCIVTTSRADYGLLRPLILEAGTDPRYRVTLVVTGSHLEPRLGQTVREIDADRIPIAVRLPIDYADFSDLAIALAVGQTTKAVAQAVNEISPDFLVVLGDRTELLAVAADALVLKVPLAHISGGEKTTGSLDDKVRHAVSMLASVHLVALDEHRMRLVRMGIPRERIFVVGRLGNDAVLGNPDMSAGQLETLTGIPLLPPILLTTYHPATASSDNQTCAATALLEALDRTPEATVVITGTNCDSEGRQIAELLKSWASANASRAVYVESLGSRAYLSLMRRSASVVGNSSSGVTEAPLLGVPTVNIGDRQDGRERAALVIDCGVDADSITKAIHRALTMSTSRTHVGVETDGSVSRRILDAIWNLGTSEITTD